MRNSRICPDNNARYSHVMCENTHRAALTLSLREQVQFFSNLRKEAFPL